MINRLPIRAAKKTSKLFTRAMKSLPSNALGGNTTGLMTELFEDLFEESVSHVSMGYEFH
jgi:hypothetical protein